MCFVHISGEAAASESSRRSATQQRERRAAVRAATAAEKVDVEKVAEENATSDSHEGVEAEEAKPACEKETVIDVCIPAEKMEMYKNVPLESRQK